MNSKVIVAAVAAIGKNRELGKGNELLWSIPEDMKHFRDVTRGHAVVMGRKTFQSIGRPLPNRTNIVVTRDENYHPDGVIVANSVEDALKRAEELESSEVMVIGGAQIYTQALPFTDKLYLTVVDEQFPEADAFFPDYSEFEKIESKRESESNGYKITFLEISRK